jgi:hypothetical protein
MIPLLAYLAVAVLLLVAAHRLVRPLSGRAAAALLLLPFAFCGYALLMNRVYAPIDLPYATEPLRALAGEHGIAQVSTGMHTDVYTEFMPWRKAVQWSLAHGEWGLRNPFAMSGDVLLGSQQAAVYSPLTLVAVTMPVALGFTFTAAITFFVAALGAFLLARELECGETAALTAAAGWAFSTCITLFLLVTMGATWAWCPFLLLAVRRVIVQPAPRTAALLTAAFAAILLSGHPESAVLCVLTGLLYAGFELAGHRTTAGRAVPYALGAAIAALLLTAIETLPFLEALPVSVQYALRQASFVDTDVVTPWRFSLTKIAATFLPYLHERQWTLAGWTPRMQELEIGAVGSVVLALALYAVIRVRTRTSWFLGGLAFFCLLVHAEWSPLVFVFRRLPVLEMTLTDRLSFGFALCASLLAAMGVQALSRRDDRRAALAILGAALVAVALGNWWAATTPFVRHDPLKFGQWKVLAEVGVLALAWLAIALRPLARFAPALLVVLIVGQRALSDGGLYHSFEQRQAYPPVPLFAAMRNVEEPFRFVATGNLFTPQTATMYGLEDVRGVPSLILRDYQETYPAWCVLQPVWFNRVDDLTRPFLSFLNVRYALSDRPAPPGWREVAHDRGSYLHENLHVLERAFVPREVSLGYPRIWNLGDIVEEQDFASMAWIDVPMRPPRVLPNGPGRLTIHQARLGYAIDARMDGEGWIVTSVPAWPGWRASVDGKPVETRNANHGFVSLHVPRGHHAVRLRYWPASFTWGAGISAGTALAMAVFAVIGRRGSAAKDSVA